MSTLRLANISSRARWRPVTALLAWIAATAVAAAAPDWLLADARSPQTEQPEEAPAVVLRDDVSYAVNPQGEWTESRRGSIRVLTAAGLNRAHAFFNYADKTDTVSRANAWLIRAGKEKKEYLKRDWMDVAEMQGETLYTDFRRMMVIPDNAAIGDVLGYEIVVRRRARLGQTSEQFDPTLPVRHAQVEFRVPPGWEPTACWFDHDTVAPQVSADRTVWTWTVPDLPFRADEPWTPRSFGARVAFSVTPPAGTKGSADPSFATWADVARWGDSLQQAQCDTSPALSEAARQLVKEATGEEARLAALASFVQERRYAQNYHNSGLGFGYRPHKATEVLASGCGDCKDKANLLCALLRETGVRAFSVLVFAGDATAIRAEWPSPEQFNHAIVAITVSPALDGPAVKEVPSLGRLLFFDPTDRWVPFGRLPWILQGSRGLVQDGAATDLIDLPQPPEADRWLSIATTRLSLGANDRLTGKARIVVGGELAAEARRTRHDLTDQEYIDRWTSRLNHTVRGVLASQVKTGDDPHRDLFETQVEFSADAFGQRAQQNLLLVQLDLLSRGSVPAFSKKTRHRPVLVPPVHDRDRVALELPAGCTVDDLPPRKELKSDYGEYSGEFAVEAGALVYRRALTLRSQIVAPADYPRFREFLIAVSRADHATVVLRAPK